MVRPSVPVLLGGGNRLFYHVLWRGQWGGFNPANLFKAVDIPAGPPRLLPQKLEGLGVPGGGKCKKRLLPLEQADSPAIVLENTNVDQLAVQAAFGQLKVRDREILALKNMGFSSQEMGSLLKISDSAARSRLAGAKSRFASQLQNHGIQV